MILYDSLVYCKHGRFVAGCVNASGEDRILTTPIIELEEVELISITPPAPSQDNASKHSKFDSRILAINSEYQADNRIKEIRNIISRSHLNEEEQGHVDELIASNYDLFYLPGDTLRKTSAVRFQRPTIYRCIQSNIVIRQSTRQKLINR